MKIEQFHEALESEEKEPTLQALADVRRCPEEVVHHRVSDWLPWG